MRHKTRLIFFLCCGLAGAAFAGCKSETAIVLTVDTQDIRIPDWMDQIKIVVTSPTLAVEKTLVSTQLDGSQGAYSATILQTDAGVKTIRVRVIGLRGGKTIGESDTVDISFEKDEIVRRTIALDVITGCVDTDEDGFKVGLGCSQEIDTDCDDKDPDVYPGAPERCNGKDDNCDPEGLIDENPDTSASDCPPRLGVCAAVPITCRNGRWDCGDPENYAAEEICGDDLDNNCDGSLYDGCPCEGGPIGEPCGPDDEGICIPGVYECIEGEVICNLEGAQQPLEEDCNGLDDDCDGVTDNISEQDQEICFEGTGACEVQGVLRCIEGEWICDAGQVPEGGPEVCNDSGWADEDCDGLANEVDDDCRLNAFSVSQCYWFYELTNDGTAPFNLCYNPLSIPLQAMPNGSLPDGWTRLWSIIAQSCPDGAATCGVITNPHQYNTTLEVTLSDNYINGVTDLAQPYTFSVKLALLDGQNEERAVYVSLDRKVPFCDRPNCNLMPPDAICGPPPPPGDDPTCPNDIN